MTSTISPQCDIFDVLKKYFLKNGDENLPKKLYIIIERKKFFEKR
jgi:hypothetical protein